MKAQMYKVTVQDDLVHLYTRRVISEVWIPKIKVGFNQEGHVFVLDEMRGGPANFQKVEFQEVEVDNKVAEEMKIVAYGKRSLEKYCQSFFKHIDKQPRK